jgi:hypothetical protein
LVQFINQPTKHHAQTHPYRYRRFPLEEIHGQEGHAASRHEPALLSIPRRHSMANPWTKKNPLMSMWLSGANRAANTARGQVTAQVKRSATQANKKAAADMTQAWLDLFAPAAAPRKKRR